jgi:hypothetical protein
MKLELTITFDSNDYLHSVIDIDNTTVKHHSFLTHSGPTPTFTPTAGDTQTLPTKEAVASYVKQLLGGVVDKALEPEAIKL